MKTKVTTIYRNGKRLPTNTRSNTVEGDLNLNLSAHPVTGMACYEAVVLTDEGFSLLPDLLDAKCISISGNGFKLRGIELVSGRELAQEWFCIPVTREST